MDPFPCWGMPIDYGDVRAVVLAHPLEHSSAVAAFGWGIGRRVEEPNSASEEVYYIRQVRDVEREESCPCLRIVGG